MTTAIKSKDFRVRRGEAVDLKSRPTAIDPPSRSEKDCHDLFDKPVEQQERIRPSDCYAPLLIFQTMDVAGKDGAINSVMSEVHPQGAQALSVEHSGANGSASSTGHPVERCWWSGGIRSCMSVRWSSTRRQRGKPTGATAAARSGTWRSTSTPAERGSLRSNFTVE